VFNINDYETVEVRLAKFIADNVDFRISTELVEASATRFIVRTSIYRTYLDAVPFATGLAYEMVSDRGVNSTSALENAETSSIGRALANAGYAAKGKRASQTEMAKVIAGETKPKAIYGTPNSRSAAIESVLRESFTVETKEPEPVQWTVGEVVDAIGTQIPNQPPECQHGHILKQGISKGGKPYYGYVCKGNVKEDAVWAKMSPNGRWYFEGDE
jgi:hypothetical protein